MAMGVDRTQDQDQGSENQDDQGYEAQDWETFFNNAYTQSGRHDAIPRDDEGNIDPRDERMDRMEMQMSMENVRRTFEKRFPDATEAQIQQFLESEVTGNVMGKFDAITGAFQTTQEKEERGDPPRSLQMEDASSDASNTDQDEAHSMEDAARRAAGLEDNYDVY